MRNRRLARLFGSRSKRTLIVPLDHGLAQGPITGLADVPSLLASLAGSGINAVVLNLGLARRCADVLAVDPGLGLIVHLSVGSKLSPDPSERAVGASIEGALVVGADAVSVHLNVGSADDIRQLQELTRVSERCQLLGIPLLAMMYLADGSTQAAKVAHAARMAAELGADVVKVPFSDPEGLRAIVRTTPCDVICAGGAADSGIDIVDLARIAVESGAAGLAVGRHVFQHSQPAVVSRQLAELLHRSPPGLRFREESVAAA